MECNHVPDQRVQEMTVREALYYPEKRLNIEEGDEIGVAIESYRVESLKRNLVSSYFSAQDSRDETNWVGFIPSGLRDLQMFLTGRIKSQGILSARRKRIDVSSELSKVVIVVFVKCGGEVLLVPRFDKDILSDVMTLTIMESLTLEDLETLFLGKFCIDPYTDLIPCLRDGYRKLKEDRDSWKSFRYDPRNFLYEGPDKLIEKLIMPLIQRSVHEEAPMSLQRKQIRFVGKVGGGKDIGVVFGIEVEPAELKLIAKQENGEIFDAYSYRYDDVATYYGGRSDGWSESILRYIRAHRL